MSTETSGIGHEATTITRRTDLTTRFISSLTASGTRPTTTK
jgi:hypothetical protein